MGFPGDTVVKNPPADTGDVVDINSILGSGRFPGGENGNPLQYSCHGQWSLVGCSPWGHKELGTTEHACAITKYSRM